MGETTARVVRGAGALALGRVVGGLLGVASTALTTRYLGARSYGFVVATMLVVTLCLSLADAGLDAVNLRELSRTDPAGRRRIMAAALALRGAVGTVAGASMIAVALAAAPPHRLRLALLLLAPVALAYGVKQAFSVGVQAVQRTELVVVGDLAGKVVGLALTIATVVSGWGLAGVLLSISAGFVVECVVDGVISGRVVASARVSFDGVRLMLVAALPVAGAVVINSLYYRADGLLLAAFRGQAAVGAYGVAYRVPDTLTMLPGMLLTTVVPLLSREAHDRARLASLVRRAAPVLLGVGTPLVLASVALAPEVVGVLAGPSFEGAVLPLRLLSLGVLPIFLGAPLSAALLAAGEERRLLRITVASLVVNVAANCALIPAFGPSGAAGALLLTEAMVVCALGALYRREVGPVEVRPDLRLLVASATSTALAWVVVGLPGVRAVEAASRLACGGAVLVAVFAAVACATGLLRPASLLGVLRGGS